MPKKTITTEEKKQPKKATSAKGGSASGGKKSTSILAEETVKQEPVVLAKGQSAFGGKKAKKEIKEVKITEVTASLNDLRITPRKTQLVADFIKGLDVAEAISRLSLLNKAAALPMKKLVQSALANARNNFKLNAEDLMVKNVIIGQGKTLKRFRPAAFGTGHALLKRSSHIRVTLAVKPEGAKIKNKSKKS